MAATGEESSTKVETVSLLAASEPIPDRSKKPWIIVAVIALAVIAGVVALLVIRSNEASQIEEAAESCGVERNVGDDGTSITFDTQGEEDLSGDSYGVISCVLFFLDTPDRVISQMDQTRALDGTLEAMWDDYEAFWNYHPDSGMNLTIYVP